MPGRRKRYVLGLGCLTLSLNPLSAFADGCAPVLKSQSGELDAATRKAAIQRVANATFHYLNRRRGDNFQAATSFHDTVFKGIAPKELDAATPIFWKSVGFGLEQAAKALKVPDIIKDAVKLGFEIHAEIDKAQQAARGKAVEEWVDELRRTIGRQETGDSDSWANHYTDQNPDFRTLLDMCRFAEIERDLGEKKPSPRWEELAPPIAVLELGIAVQFLSGGASDNSLGSIGYLDLDLRGFPLANATDPRRDCGGRQLGDVSGASRIVLPHAPSLRTKLRDKIQLLTYHESRLTWIANSVEAFGTERPEEITGGGRVLVPSQRDSIFDLGAIVRMNGHVVFPDGSLGTFDGPFAVLVPDKEQPLTSYNLLTPYRLSDSKALATKAAGLVEGKRSCFKVKALQ